MKERPILFSAPMVRAILNGSKTQTRRVAKADGDYRDDDGWPLRYVDGAGDLRAGCPYGAPGDRLWVRETWGWDWYDDGNSRAWKLPVYRADGDTEPLDNGSPAPWKPSIHMPRALSRITLQVTDVRIERLQDISARDAWAEGIPFSPDVNPWHEYGELWESINGAGSWDANSWVWVVGFRRA